MSASKPPLILVDGSSYLFRAFHALPPLTNSKGLPTGAAYGVVNMLKKLVDEYQPTHFGVVFDPKGDTFRNEIYDEYKANRDAMPDDLRVQIEPLFNVIRALGWPLIIKNGFEADDVIGTLAVNAREAGHKVLISTGDKDLAQLVNEDVTLVNTMNMSFMDPAGVQEKFGVPPNRIIDYLALVGDTVDNIPGVHKCGPKTAVKWLGLYDSLDGVVANADEVGGKVGEYLREALPKMELNRELVTIRLDVPIEERIEDLQPTAPDEDQLADLYRELEFKTWLREVLANGAEDAGAGGQDALPAAVESDYETILTDADLDRWITDLKAAELFAFDTETTSLDYMVAEIVGVSFATEPGKAAYVPLTHDYLDAPDQLNREAVLEKLRPLLEGDEPKIVGQNLKYDAHILENHGITLKGIAHDTMLESFVLNSVGSRHDMDTLALKYLGRSTVKFSDIAGKGKNQLTFNQIAIEEAGHYAAEDADITLQLHLELWPKLQAIQPLQKLYEDIELPLAPVLEKIEHTGVLIDPQLLAQQSQELAVKMVELEAKAHELAGGPFNLSSTKQLQEILFEKLELPVIKKTPKGAPSTNEEVLSELANEHELPAVILQNREMSKLRSTYTDKLPGQINQRTGRVHTSYHQAVAATGRLSSQDPNLQNIPIRTTEGRRVRQAFIAPKGYTLLAADYSQIELRIMAHLSEDEGLLKAFANDEDVHRVTASEVFGVEQKDVDDSQRRAAKAVNFGLIYGMSAFGLARQLKIDRGQAQTYIDAYFNKFPGVQRYMDETREQAREDGYVETLFGRRLYLPEINHSNGQRRQYAERTAINAPMQGTAADIIKRAMLAVDDWLTESKADCRVIMQVHDELVCEVADAKLDEYKAKIIELMSGAAELKVPLLVEAGVGANWDEAH